VEDASGACCPGWVGMEVGKGQQVQARKNLGDRTLTPFREWTGLRVLMQNQPRIMSRTEPVLSITTREEGSDNEQNRVGAVHYHKG